MRRFITTAAVLLGVALAAPAAADAATCDPITKTMADVGVRVKGTVKTDTPWTSCRKARRVLRKVMNTGPAARVRVKGKTWIQTWFDSNGNPTRFEYTQGRHIVRLRLKTVPL